MHRKVFSWREAIQASTLQPTTRFVLFNLSFYLSSKGESCFPSIETQAQDTGLTPRCVITHLQLAEAAGYLLKKKHGYAGQKWARNEYLPCYPEGSELASSPFEKVVKQVPKGSEAGSCEVVKQVHTNTPEEYSIELSNNKKNNIKKGKMPSMSIGEWEDQNGRLTFENIKSWADENNLFQPAVENAIELFRERCASKPYHYADFCAAFKTWQRKNNFEGLRAWVEAPPTPPRNMSELAKVTFYDNNNI